MSYRPKNRCRMHSITRSMVERRLQRPRRTKRLILRTMRTGPMPLSRAMRASGRVRLLVMDGSARCAGTSSKSMSFPMISSVLSAASGKRTSFASSCDRGGPAVSKHQIQLRWKEGSYSRRTAIGVSGFCSCRRSGLICIVGEKIANGLLLMQRVQVRLPVRCDGSRHVRRFVQRAGERGGYSPFSTIEFDADDKKSLFRESRALFLLYSQRSCP